MGETIIAFFSDMHSSLVFSSVIVFGFEYCTVKFPIISFAIIRIIWNVIVPNQKCMHDAALAISGYHWLYLVIFGIPLEPYYFEFVIVGFR